MPTDVIFWRIDSYQPTIVWLFGRQNIFEVGLWASLRSPVNNDGA
jgi:hypothetical protein